MSTNDEGRGSGVWTWFRNLSGIRKLIAGVVAVATAVGAVAGAVEATGNLIEWGESVTKEPTGLRRTPNLGLEFWQNETQNDMFIEDPKAIPLREVVTVPMKREPFELRLPQQDEDVGIRVLAWTDDSIFNLETGKTPRGAWAGVDAPGLGNGQGMFSTEFGTGVLVLSKRGHNYYAGNRRTTENGQNRMFISAVSTPGEREQSSTRVPMGLIMATAIQEKVVDEVVIDEPLPKAGPPGSGSPENTVVQTYTPLAELNKDIFLLVFIDKDKDDHVNEGEYEYVVLDF